MPSQRVWRRVKIILGVAIILFASAFLLTYSAYPSPHNLVPSSSSTTGETTSTSDQQEDPDVAKKKAVFIQQASGWQIDGPYNNTALTKLCAKQKWVTGLQFKCAAAYGGIGNIRNIVLTCVRFAIEAGATTILIPEIIVRGTDLIHLTDGEHVPFTYMFDLDVFKSRLTTACPKIRLVSNEANLAEFPSPIIRNLTPRKLGTEFKVGRVIDFLPAWRGAFDTWVKDFAAPTGFSASKPLLIHLQPTFFEYPILHDEPEFIATFGRILEFRKDVRRLAAVVTYALDKKYKLELNPGAAGVPAPNKYYGAHLRTDVDALAANFASYREQSSAYLKGAKEHNLHFIYLASGSKNDIKRFTRDAKAIDIKVTTKNALLGGKEYAAELEEMKKLTWDQQALVDFALLSRSSHFGGTWASSFAYNIAFQRHVAVENGTWTSSMTALAQRRDKHVTAAKGTLSDKERLVGRDNGVTTEFASGKDDPRRLLKGEDYKDAVSTIYGPPLMGVWFELSMWP
ncbi:uncharacterized protein RAG0_15863 [Rhynchosporium agropyri]|uniref:Alternative oxidase n=1 Tax=Rhynchosporium agropyri TaxID=914238 RepID=A0A1E1LMU2_9HELO|nr:uncharacterized protein RAG0_15863 [Rhynchosporium agropyri]